MSGAFKTGKYRNVLAELGISEEDIEKRVKDSFHTVFYGSDDERFFHKAGDNMGYFE